MGNESKEHAHIDSQEMLRLLDDARSRLRTVIWALHGMHQDMSVLTVDDLSDVEHMLTEILENALTPSYEAMSELLGARPGGAVTTH